MAATTCSIRGSELATLLVDRWAAERWSRGAIEMVAGGPCRLTDVVGTEWLGQVAVVEPSSGCSIRLTNPYDQTRGPVEYRIVASGDDVGHLEVSTDVAPDEPATRLWQSVVERIESMVFEIRGRRTPEQAVVVIHGIGEQLPGRTLAGFVEAMTATAGSPVWNVADRVSGSYELRQLTLAPSDSRPRTTFYEYYWAHEVSDTTVGDVFGWLSSVMIRPPWAIPKLLRSAWLVLWALVASIAVTALTVWNGVESVWWVSGGVTVVLGIGASFLIRYLGDAARYLSPRPRNIAIREAIRRRGVDLVRELHASGRYHRVVLVGHSLGSVVAYDIVTHLWPEMHREHLRPDTATFKAIRTAERGDGDRSGHSLQASAWREMRRNTQPWLVTDLVTVGSPLAHAHLLLARSAADFRRKCENAEVATAPPARTGKGDRFSFERPYRSRSDRAERAFTMLSEAAPFGAVRWTNLYFPARFGLFGDVVGGPVAPVFGPWVRDEALTEGLPWWRRLSILAHTGYWRTGAHVEALRRAVALDSMGSLEDEAAKHDLLLYCRTRS